MRKVENTGSEITKEQRLQEIVVSTLGRSTKPVSGSQLAELASHKTKLNVSDVQIRRVIRELRASGSTIIATTRGYCIAENKAQVLDYVTSRKQELKRETRALDAMVRSFRRAVAE
jgi:transcriptional regulator of NAD metabolism